MKPEQQKQQKQQQKDDVAKQQQEKEKYGPTRNNESRDGKPPKDKIGALYQKLLANDRWGLLPPQLRSVIRNAQGKEPPTRYRQILYKYYEKLGNVSREGDK